ncbi:hypothetical protein SEVIR_2G214901v4 [Setaria viridis]
MHVAGGRGRKREGGSDGIVGIGGGVVAAARRSLPTPMLILRLASDVLVPSPARPTMHPVSCCREKP